jgi:hypothetical protein
MVAADGKMYITDVADTEQLFRLILSVPSPKARPSNVVAICLLQNKNRKKESHRDDLFVAPTGNQILMTH